jgi:hypothetical protein
MVLILTEHIMWWQIGELMTDELKHIKMPFFMALGMGTCLLSELM